MTQAVKKEYTESFFVKLDNARFTRAIAEMGKFGSWATTNRVEARNFEKYLNHRGLEFYTYMERSLFVFELL